MYSLESDRRWLQPLLIFGALLVIVALMRGPGNSVTAPPSALQPPAADVALEGRLAAQPGAETASQPFPALDGHEAVLRVGSLALYTSAGSYSAEQVRALAPSLSEALSYVEERTAMSLGGDVAVVFDRRSTCGFDGAAYTERRTIVLYACPDVPQRRAVNILAHELVHQLAHDHFGPTHLQADLILSEGLATWGAGRYWLGNEPGFPEFVGRHYAAQLLPLGSHYRDHGSIDAMNRLYYQWASLIDYIIATHGRDAVDQLYRSGRGASPNTADYQAVLGTDLVGLEAAWRDWILQAP